MSQPSDPSTVRDLIDRAQDDSAAMGELLAIYSGRLLRFVEFRLDSRVKARIDPADVVQDILAEAYKRIHDYLENRPIVFYGWLRQLAENRMIDLHRRHVTAQNRSVDREHHDGTDGQFLHAGSTPSERLTRQEQVDFVRATLEKLDSSDRELITMRHFEQLSTGEVAELVGISEGAVRTRLVRALKRFKEVAGGDKFDSA